MAFEIFSWSMVAISLGGTVMNIRGNPWCWYVWSVGNAGWIAVGLGSQVYSLAALQGIYLLMNVWGVRSWSKAHKEIQSVLEKLEKVEISQRLDNPES